MGTPVGVQRSSHPQASGTSEPVASAFATKEVAPPPSTTVAPAPVPVPVAQVNSVAETPGSKLFVGPNIKLKGVEISDCDVLIVEGHVEATVFSKGLQIAQPGTLNGTVAIDIAEIYGSFSGELTARTRLVVHGTGRVSGKIRYGKLIVAEGGELTGDVRQIDGAEDHPQLSLTAGRTRARPRAVKFAAEKQPAPTRPHAAANVRCSLWGTGRTSKRVRFSRHGPRTGDAGYCRDLSARRPCPPLPAPEPQ